MYPREKVNKPFEGRMKPFKIVGNVYFVGTYQASSHLIDTGDGLILIDTGYANTLYLLLESIWELGYKPQDIKYIVHSHWHGDHTAGTECLAELSGAKTVIGEHDREPLLKAGYFTPDITVADGDTLTLGNTTLRFLHTPGHTVGTVSIFFDTVENGKTYRVGTFGGAGANTLTPDHQSHYPSCREDYLASIERLLKEEVDVFIGNHCWNNDTKGKAAVLAQGGENPFIDPNEWPKFLNFCAQRCKALPPV